jgi:glycosyltransferase involved in cell wall biosynthesis
MLPVPFIWGPVGGGESAPTAFRKDFSFRGKNYEFLRDLIRWVGERDPFVLLTAQKSTVALAQTEETAQRLRSLRVKEVQVFFNTGLPKEDISLLAQCGVPEEGVVRFISMGRLIDWKGFHLGLRAFALLKIERAEYWIMGDGYARKRLEALARKLGVEKKVRFWGNLPHQEMLSKLRECHLLVHPSLHDSGGGVCAEMMAAGRPVICLDLGGPATQVTGETGIKVPAYNPEQVVRDLADAMTHLACNPELRVRMGEAGRMRVSDLFNWDVKGKFFAQLYEEILDREKSSDSPSQ